MNLSPPSISSIQARIINLLDDIQQQFGSTYLLTPTTSPWSSTSASARLSCTVGGIVEIARAIELYRAPFHPYTEGLAAFRPSPYPGRDTDCLLQGEIPRPVRHSTPLLLLRATDLSGAQSVLLLLGKIIRARFAAGHFAGGILQYPSA